MAWPKKDPMPVPGRKKGAKKPPPELARQSMLAQMKGPRTPQTQGLNAMPGSPTMPDDPQRC